MPGDLVGPTSSSALDRALKCRRQDRPPKSAPQARRSAAAHRWMLEHFENSDGLGAIFPPMIYYRRRPRMPGVRSSNRRPMKLGAPISSKTSGSRKKAPIRVQPCHSPVWDTAIATIALAGSKATPDFHPSLLPVAVRWLLEREVRVAGATGYARGLNRCRAERLALSSSGTSVIPISTTPRWSCSPSRRRRPATSPR